jgi:adenosylmethionine-8-amino-7-oxononanoate aminotransferase
LDIQPLHCRCDLPTTHHTRARAVWWFYARTCRVACRKLTDILPSNQKKIFFSDNGSTSVEVAIKVALQYFYNKGAQRKTIIAFENAFHGDTFAAMAASGISFYTQAFEGMFIDVVRIPFP